MALTPKQDRFVAEYLVDLNATQAAIRAGYSRKTANEQGARLLAKDSVSEAVAAGQKKISDKLEISAQYVLGGLKNVADSGEEEHNRVKAFELLGKHLKLFTEKHQHEHSFDAFTDEQLEAKFRKLTGGLHADEEGQ